MDRLFKLWLNHYEGEGDKKTEPPPPPKTFTQDEVNAIMAKEKREFQSKQQTMAEELEALKQKANLTDEERTTLEKRIETIRSESMSKEELAKRDRDKLVKTHETEKDALVKERDLWRNRFTDATIIRGIQDAAIENKAFKPQQIVSMLRSETRLVEVLDGEGKPTGEFAPKITLSDSDKDGKPVTLELTIKDAVKRMKDMPDYANLFVGEGTGGVGGSGRAGGGSGGGQKLVDVANDPAKYRELRKKGVI